jgi:hypothetical protein
MGVGFVKTRKRRKYKAGSRSRVHGARQEILTDWIPVNPVPYTLRR